MTYSTLLKNFDDGVEAAHKKKVELFGDDLRIAFTHEFAGFAFYEQRNIQRGTSSEPEDWRCELLDDRDTKEPILWSNLHKPLSRILREDKDLRKCYAGFATLFTVNPYKQVDEPSYASMVIDVDLDAPGFQGLLLSKEQFEKKQTIPLTAICLNTTGETDFQTVPVAFHWSSPDCSDEQNHPRKNSELASWGHVHICSELPKNKTTGLELDINTIKLWGDRHPDIVKVIDTIDSQTTEIVFGETEFYRRLSNYQQHVTRKSSLYTKKDLATLLAWTVCYFVYGCEQFLKKTPKDFPGHLAEDETLDQLTIICAPASYSQHTSAALYVPVCFKTKEFRLSDIAVKVLSLSRSLGMPLEMLKEHSLGEREGAEKAQDFFSHLAKPLIKRTKRMPLPFSEIFNVVTNNKGQDSLVMRPDQDANVDYENCIVIPNAVEFNESMDQILLWTLGNSMVDLPFYKTDKKMPSDLISLAQECFHAAKRRILFEFADEIHSYCQGNFNFRGISELDDILEPQLPKLTSLTSASSMPINFQWTQANQPHLINLSRFLILMFKEAFEHGAWEKEITYYFDKKDFTFTVSNSIFNYSAENLFAEKLDCDKADCLWEIRKKLSDRNPTWGFSEYTHHGKAQLKYLANKAELELIFCDQESINTDKYTVIVRLKDRYKRRLLID